MECFDDLADGPVDFFDDVAVDAASGVVFEFFGAEEWDVGEAVGEVEEEGLVLVLFDKLDGFFGEAFGDGGLVGGAFDDFFVAHEWDVVVFGLGAEAVEAFVAWCVAEAVHVVGVGDAVVGVEAVGGGEVWFEVAEVPFADGGGGVAFLFECFGDGDFGLGESAFGVGEEDASLGGGHAGADGESAGEESGA